MSDFGKAVFLSYASQDAEAARRICESLRSSGVEVWFDADGGLEHGDEWDAKIRRQIKECVLFIPIISANTQAREEGYFRIEWDLAAERARGIASGIAFILPVVIDDTREPNALVPDRFRMVQWTRLRGGEMTPEVKARYLKLWSHRIGAVKAEDGRPQSEIGGQTSDVRNQRSEVGESHRRKWRRSALMAGAVAVVVLGGLAIWRPWKGSSAPGSMASSPEVADLIRRAWKLVDNPGRGRTELEAADDLCKRAAALEPTNASVLAVWAEVDSWMILLKVDDSPTRREAGRAKAKRAVQLAPEAFEPRLALACFQVRDAGYRAPENAPEIEATLRGLLRERPGEPHALVALGMLQRFAGKSAESRKTFEELAKNADFAAAAWCEMAYMHFEAREYREAEQTVEASIARQPFFWNLSMKTFLALYWRGDLDLAVATLDRIPREALREDHGFIVAVWVHTLRRDGEALLRLLENTPREWIGGPSPGPKAAYMAFAYKFLGREQAAAVERSAALRLLERRLSETPNAVDLLSLKCWILGDQGNLTEASRVSQLLREIRNPREQAGELLDRVVLGEFDAAIDILEKREKEYSVHRLIDVTPGEPFFTAAFVRHIWWLDPLRDHPRFQALQARLDANPRFAPEGNASAPPVAAAKDKSVAVLAFKNVGGDSANEAIVEGIGLELISRLGRVPGLTVRGNSSLSFFKGSDATTQEKGRRLDATYLVDGSVQRAGDTLRISANLTRATTNEIVWSSEPLNRSVREIFSVQEEIAGLIAKNLSLTLNAGSAPSRAAVNPEAVELYVRARQAWNLRTMAGFARAEELLNRALVLEPNFARAHAALADVWSIRGQDEPGGTTFGNRHSPLRQKVLARIRHALDLDPASAEAHASLGSALWTGWEIPAGERALRRAIELNPNYASAHQWLGRALLVDGRIDEALAELKIALELDPLSTRIADNYALGLRCAGRFSESLAVYDQALAVQPGALQASWQKAQMLHRLGRQSDADAILRGMANVEWPSLSTHLTALATSGWHAEAAALLPRLDPRADDIAFFLAHLGRTEQALAALNPDATEATQAEEWLTDPVFDPMRADPRFAKFLATLGMTDAHARVQAWRAAHPPEKVPPKK